MLDRDPSAVVTVSYTWKPIKQGLSTSQAPVACSTAISAGAGDSRASAPPGEEGPDC